MSESGDVVVSDRDFWVMGVAFVMLMISVGVVIVNLFILTSQARKADQTYAAACSYLNTLKDQAKTSEQYLQKHPDGAPALGITAAQLQQSIDKEQAAISSLSGLNCNSK